MRPATRSVLLLFTAWFHCVLILSLSKMSLTPPLPALSFILSLHDLEGWHSFLSLVTAFPLLLFLKDFLFLKGHIFFYHAYLRRLVHEITYNIYKCIYIYNGWITVFQRFLHFIWNLVSMLIPNQDCHKIPRYYSLIGTSVFKYLSERCLFEHLFKKHLSITC